MSLQPPLFRCRIGDKIYGPLNESDLRKLPGFTLHSLIAPINEKAWRPAYEVIAIADSQDWSMVPGVGRVLDLGLRKDWR